ncbi:MAG: TRAP transporter substrate-binding protein [Eubacteriales bacterium]|nr:TRAP transporter substrate-binding protein [Eubacteriales bacterium]
MKKRIFAGLLAASMVASLTACGGSSTASTTAAAPAAAPAETKAEAAAPAEAATEAAAPSGDVVTLKLGHIQNEQDIWHLSAEVLAEKAAEYSNGTLKIDIYPNSTLGGDRDMAEGMQMGTVDMALIAGVLSNFDESISLLEIPYIFRSNEEFEKIVYGPCGEEIAQNVIDNSGIRILDWWERGPRLITATKEIHTVEDMKGLKIRVPEIKAMEEVFNAWGAAPTTMAWSEVYTSLQQGVIEAQENPIPFFYSSSIYEVCKYIIETKHKYEYVCVTVADDVWNKLSADQQEALKKASADATAYHNENVQKVADDDLKDMIDNQGVTVIEPDTTGFVAIAEEVAPKYAESIGYADLYNKIEAELGR